MGLLSSVGNTVGGLLGKQVMGIPVGAMLGIPQSEEHLRTMLAGGPEKMAELERIRRQQQMEELQLKSAQMQMEQFQKAQGKDDITSAMIQSMNLQVADAVQRLRSSLASNDMAGAQKARNELDQLQSPEYQNLLRGHLATQGNLQMAEQAGMVAPLQQPMAPTNKMREYEFARQNGFEGSFTDFMQMSGANTRAPYYTVVPTTQGLMRFNSATGELTPVGDTPLVRPGDDPSLQGEIAGAKAGGRMTAENDVKALSDLPTVEASAAEMDTLLSELAAHPGKSQAVGTRSMLPVIPGSPAAGFVARLEQVQGKAFLQAYESLKGGGAITEIEGKKAEQAIGRLSRAQSEEDFNQALSDLQDVVAVGLSRARRRAQQAQTRRGGPAAPVPNSSPAQSQSAPPSNGWGIVRKN